MEENNETVLIIYPQMVPSYLYPQLILLNWKKWKF